MYARARRGLTPAAAYRKPREIDVEASLSILKPKMELEPLQHLFDAHRVVTAAAEAARFG